MTTNQAITGITSTVSVELEYRELPKVISFENYYSTTDGAPVTAVLGVGLSDHAEMWDKVTQITSPFASIQIDSPPAGEAPFQNASI